VGDYLHCGFSIGWRHIHASRWEDVTGFSYVSAHWNSSVRNFILLKDQFVNPSAEPYSKGIRSRHADKSTRFCESVNRLFLFIFSLSPSVTSKNHASRKQANVYKDASKTHANQNRAMRCHFAPVSTTLPKRGKTPESANIVETRKSDPYIPIITYRRQWPAIPIPPFSSPHSIPHSSHPAQLRHATGSILSRSQPDNDTGMT